MKLIKAAILLLPLLLLAAPLTHGQHSQGSTICKCHKKGIVNRMTVPYFSRKSWHGNVFGQQLEQ